MPRARSIPYVVRRPDQLGALASPVRQEIVDAAAVAGPCLVAGLAEVLGRRPDSLYYHVRSLEACGLLVRRGTRRTGRRRAAVYDVPGRPLSLRYDTSDRRSTRAVVAVVSGLLRLARRDFRRALGSGLEVVEGPRRNLWGSRAKGWLTQAEIRRINRSLRGITDILKRARRRPGAGLHAFAFVLAPTPARGAPSKGPRGRRHSRRGAR